MTKKTEFTVKRETGQPFKEKPEVLGQLRKIVFQEETGMGSDLLSEEDMMKTWNKYGDHNVHSVK